MEPIKYVSEEAVARAREWENRFLGLPPEAGIFFVAVDAIPVFDGKSLVYEVRLGTSRSRDEDAALALIKRVLAQEIEEGEFRILASVYLGRAGSGRDTDTQGTDSTSA